MPARSHGPRLDRYQSFSHKLSAINIFLFFLLAAIRLCVCAVRARERELAVLNDLFGVARVVQINNGVSFRVCPFTFVFCISIAAAAGSGNRSIA